MCRSFIVENSTRILMDQHMDDYFKTAAIGRALITVPKGAIIMPPSIKFFAQKIPASRPG